MGIDHSKLVEKIRAMAEAIGAPLGLEVVDLAYRGSGKRALLRVDIDRPGPEGVGIEDCRRVSGLLGDALDDAGLIDQGYTLEVSSPGLDRPIVTSDDLRRNVGRRIVVDTSVAVSGRRRLQGVLLAWSEEALRLREDGGQEVVIPRFSVLRARGDSRL